MKYTEMRAYGFNIIMKQHCGFPSILPLPCHMEHGWTPFSKPLISDLRIAKDKNLMLVFSKRRRESWKKDSNIPVEIMGAPFIHYRRNNNILQDRQATGTIAFPSHSTSTLTSKFEIGNYCNELSKLPLDFKPVTICLHHNEIGNGQENVYKNHGFQVVTAGGKLGNSLSFVENFYNILRKYKYATSNEIGSHTLYAVEMGLPFFILGEPPKAINRNNQDPNNPAEIKMTDFYYGNMGMKLFSTGPIKTITNEQKNFIESESGINDCLNPKDLKKILMNVFQEENYLLKAMPIYLLSFVISKIELTPIIDHLIMNFKRMFKNP